MARYFLSVLCFVTVEFVCGVTVEERLDELERVIRLQHDTLSHHESLIREQCEKLESFENENRILKDRVEVLENAIYVKQLHEMRDADEDESITLRSDDKQRVMSEDVRIRRSSTVQNDGGEISLSDIAQRRQAFNLSGSGNIAFYAHSLAPGICLHANEVLVFTVEDIDVGNAYNKDDGIYVVRVTGIYVFTWTATSNFKHRSQIIVNGHARGSTDVTGLIVTNVVAGDHVYIRTLEGYAVSSCRTFGNINVDSSSFAGYLLF